MMLLFDHDFIRDDDRHAVVTGRRFDHLRRIIRPALGDTVTVGLLNGPLGEARVIAMSSTAIELEVHYEGPPPAALPVTLLMALPRPKSLFKIVQHATTLGVKALHFYNSSRVDKSFWQSRRLQPEALHNDIWLGLEQARDTVEPQIVMHRLFAPFINDVLPDLIAHKACYLAHPDSDHGAPCPR
ncbi:MAG: 16S rRNA (uracil(1498)-N(3))-methyltransferase, partial [Myxococcota bacterium]